ncbi:MAG: outer membrane beta-barrel protein [Gemmatimonadales bacterium]
MRCLASGIAAVALLAHAGVAPAEAQGVRFGAGAGPTFNLEDDAGTDFHVMGTLGFGGAAGRPLGFRVDGMWQFADGGSIINGTGNLVYTFSVSDETKFRPYLIGGVGAYYFDPDGGDSSTEFGINAGAGFTAPVGSGTTKLFGEARFHNIFTEGESTNILPLTLGVMFGGN